MSTINLRQNFRCTLESLQQDFVEICERRGLTAAEQEALLQQVRLSDDKPVMLGLGITNRCNLTCSMCYYHSPDAKLAVPCSELSFDTISELIDCVPHFDSILIALEGEPLLHSDFLGVLEKALQAAPCVMLVTNGQALTAALCTRMHQMLQRYPNKALDITISLESVDPELYAKLRGGSFTRLDRNIQQALQFFPNLRLHMVVSNQNISKIGEILSYAQENGIKALSFDELNECENALVHGLRRVAPYELLDTFLKLLQQAQDLGVHLLFSQNFFSPQVMLEFKQRCSESQLKPIILEDGQHRCPYIYNFAAVVSGLRIFPCCGELLPSQISKISFDEIFNHDYLVYLRALWRLGCIPEVCKICLKTL